MKETDHQTDTEFLSTVFLCSEFKLENIEFGVNFRRKKVCSNYFLQELIFADHQKNRKSCKNFVPRGILTCQSVV